MDLDLLGELDFLAFCFFTLSIIIFLLLVDGPFWTFSSFILSFAALLPEADPLDGCPP